MKIKDIKPRLQNRYHIVLSDASTSKIKKEIYFHNTVTTWWEENIMKTFSTNAGDSYTSDGFYLGLGTGSGSHQASDSGLFTPVWHQLYTYSGDIIHQAGESYFTYKQSITLSEQEGNGNLTELSISVGWSGSPGNCTGPICLANFQDAEGHTITIEKTDTDVLTLDIELQLTLDTSDLPSNVHISMGAQRIDNQIIAPVGRYYSDPTCMTDINIKIGPRSYNRYQPAGNIASWILPFRDYSLGISLNGNRGLGYTTAQWSKSSGSWSNEEVGSDLVYRAAFSDIALSSQANLTNPDEIYQIMSLGFRLDSYNIGIDLPDHNIFPPTELTFQLEGDGTTTDFNLPVPILMPDSESTPVSVSVDNVTLSSGYTWYGKNWNLIQTWDKVCDWNNVSSCSVTTSGSYTGIPTAPYLASSGAGYGNTEIIYDFGEAITIDCVGRLNNNLIQGSGASIQYSISHPYSWVDVKVWNDSSSYGLEHLVSPITARYWRIVPNVYGRNGSISSQKPGMPVIGDWATSQQPTISFATPPAAGSVITITAYTEYPLKSSDWIYRTASIDISKSAGVPI